MEFSMICGDDRLQDDLFCVEWDVKFLKLSVSRRNYTRRRVDEKRGVWHMATSAYRWSDNRAIWVVGYFVVSDDLRPRELDFSAV